MTPTLTTTETPRTPCFIIPLRPLLLSLLATTYSTLTTTLTPEPPKPEGRLLRLSTSRRLHILPTAPSQPSKTPCVVLEAGANSWSPMWRSVSALLTPHFRVLRYDRAGYGASDAAPVPRPVSSIVDDLQLVVRQAAPAGPYVLVAHSLGALYINHLLKRLENVVGVVYVDAASVETVRMLRGVVPGSIPPKWLARLLSSLGVLRLLAPTVLRPYASAFKGSLGVDARRTWARAEWLLAYTAEWVAAQELCDSVTGYPPGWLGDLPISVIVPDVYERTRGKAYVGELQRSVANYSSDAVVVEVKNCGHFVQIERPDVVVDAVWNVIKRAREKRSLRDEMSFTS